MAAYVELGEFAAAAKAFSLICEKIDPSLHLAADRARLLPYPGDQKGPELIFADFLTGKVTVGAQLQALAAGVRPSLTLVFDQSELVA